jgi:hypothetical protein
MLYNYLIFFLGFYSWNFKPRNIFDRQINSRYISELPPPPLKNNKKLINYLEHNTNSPWNTVSLSITISNEIDFNKSIKIYLYQLYSFLIFLLLVIQPIYLIIMAFFKINNFESFLISFLCHINTPINYLWAKYYYKYNHFLKYFINYNLGNCKNCDKLLMFMLLGSLITIIFNLVYKSTFINKYNCYYIFFNENENENINALTYIFSITEWIYARSLYALTASSFTIVFCNHVNELIIFKNRVNKNEFEMENNYCLTKMITNIASLRHGIELSIGFYNDIISFITATGTLSLGLFIRHKLDTVKTSNIQNLNIIENDIYLIQSYFLFICFQIIFFINIYRYSKIRTLICKRLLSSEFINHFLTRWTVSKVKSKCATEKYIHHQNENQNENQNEILFNTKILLCIDEENATTLDWFVLDKLINIKWMDFKIMGISFDDGELIKRTIALSSILLVLLGYI